VAGQNRFEFFGAPDDQDMENIRFRAVEQVVDMPVRFFFGGGRRRFGGKAVIQQQLLQSFVYGVRFSVGGS